MTRVPLFVANWKMNKLGRDTSDFIEAFLARIVDFPKPAGTDFELAIAPQTAYLDLTARHLLGKPVELASQNGGSAKSGAFTGEVSPAALKELGVKWVILGHSERRHVFKEDDALVQARMNAAFHEALNVILCVGETLAERKAGKTWEVVESQLRILKDKGEVPWSRLAIAYEPVWAIGTGETATPEQAQEVHDQIRRWIGANGGPADAIRILYGGSVKPENSASLFQQPDVDGFLVGTSSLDAAVFAELIRIGLQSRD